MPVSGRTIREDCRKIAYIARANPRTGKDREYIFNAARFDHIAAFLSLVPFAAHCVAITPALTVGPDLFPFQFGKTAGRDRGDPQLRPLVISETEMRTQFRRGPRSSRRIAHGFKLLICQPRCSRYDPSFQDQCGVRTKDKMV